MKSGGLDSLSHPALGSYMLGGKHRSIVVKNVIFAVYDPPRIDLPYLAVLLNGNGDTVARPFSTAAEAEAFNSKMARESAERLGGQNA